MKRFGLIISALALVLGLSQCKKPNVPVYNGNYGVITFNAVGGGSKGDFYQDGESLKLKWQSGDKLYVYASESSTGFDVETGTFLGTMDIVSGIGQEGARFRGNINTVGKKYLRFVHVGQDIDVDANGNASCCYASQNGLIEEGVNNIAKKVFAHVDLEVRKDGNYTGIMKTEYSVIEFDMKYFKGNPVKVTGYTKDQISLNTKGSIEMSKSEASEISLGTIVNDNYYMIVLPENAGEVYSFTDGTNTYNRELKNGIVGGIFYSNAGGPTHIIPEDALPGFFEIRPDGTQIHFSKGNLQYLGKSKAVGTWRFADNQYDYMGQVTKTPVAAHKGNVDIEGYTYYNYNSTAKIPTVEDTISARDLFGWGCTGYIDTRSAVDGSGVPTYQKYYQPYNTYSVDPINGSDNGYGPDSKVAVADRYNLTIENKSDWGCIPTLTGNTETSSIWFTLSKDEWCWLVGPGPVNLETSHVNYPKPGTNCRESSTINGVNNARAATANVNGVNGLMIFPDLITWPEDVALPVKINQVPDLSWVGTENVYTAADFVKLQKAGVVFLPAAGYMIGLEGGSISHPNKYCNYWSITTSTGANNYRWNAHFVRFGSVDAQVYAATQHQVKQYHFSVRLVTLAK